MATTATEPVTDEQIANYIAILADYSNAGLIEHHAKITRQTVGTFGTRIFDDASEMLTYIEAELLRRMGGN